MANLKDIEGVPYRITKAEDSTASMVADTLGLTDLVTDFNPGGIYRTLLEALGIQLEELDTKVFFGILRAIPAILYEAFAFPPRPAIAATGKVTFSRTDTSALVNIPKNTVVTTQQISGVSSIKRYVTTADASLPIGASNVVIPIRAVDFGIVGNTGAKTINQILASIPSVTSVVNNFALVNGEEAETEDAREERFRTYVTNLARAQLKGVEAGALSVTITDVNGNILEAVKFARAIEHEFILARFELFIDNGGASASQDLIDKVQEVIDGKLDLLGVRTPGYKAAGIVGLVLPIEPKSVNVVGKITPDPGFLFEDVRPNVEKAISDFITSLGPFNPMHFVDLLSVIGAVDGVKEASITTPASTVIAARGERLLPGVITLTEMVEE